MSFNIIGTGSATPAKIVTNDDLSAFLDTSDEWIRTRTGIAERRVCTTETLTDLAGKAARSALETAGISSAEIDLIICATVQGDYVTPSLACMVQKEIGAACPAFDINAACSGFIYALDVAAAYFKSNGAKKILIVCAEMMSRHVDWTDRSTCVLFGDGAGAVVLEQGNGLLAINLTAEGNEAILNIGVSTHNSPYLEKQSPPHFLHMSGQEVYKFAVSSIQAQTKIVLGQAGLEPEDVTYYLLHQANLRIIDAARIKLKQPKEKFPVIIGRAGNTSAVSIPLLLDDLAKSGKLKKDDTLLFSAFGGGLTTGTCLIKWKI